MLSFLDPLKGSHRQKIKEQLKMGFGAAKIDFKGISPIYWLYEWTSVEATDFQNKRNELLNKRDFFFNDPWNIKMLAEFETLLIVSFYILLNNNLHFLNRYGNIGEHNSKNDNLWIIMIVLCIFHTC